MIKSHKEVSMRSSHHPPYSSILPTYTSMCHPFPCPYSISLKNRHSHFVTLSLSHSLTMDTLLHTPTSMAKRPCSFPSSPSPSPNPNMNNQLDNLLRTFLKLADSPSLSIDHSFEHLLESSPCDADKSLLIDRALKLGSLLLEAGKRSARKRSSVHNSLTWALPPDLTIKVCFIVNYHFPHRFFFKFLEFECMQVACCVLLVDDDSRFFFPFKLHYCNVEFKIWFTC